MLPLVRRASGPDARAAPDVPSGQPPTVFYPAARLAANSHATGLRGSGAYAQAAMGGRPARAEPQAGHRGDSPAIHCPRSRGEVSRMAMTHVGRARPLRRSWTRQMACSRRPGRHGGRPSLQVRVPRVRSPRCRCDL